MEQTIISKFQYTTPRIINFNYLINQVTENKEWSIKLKHQKHIKKISPTEATVSLKMIVDTDEDTTPFEIGFVVEANFRWEGYDDETISTLLSQTAPSLLIGYARPLVAMFTNSSGITTFNIPMIDFTKEPIVNFSEL